MIELFIVAVLAHAGNPLAFLTYDKINIACEDAKEQDRAQVYRITLSDSPKIERVKCKRVEATGAHWKAEVIPPKDTASYNGGGLQP